MLKLFKQYIKAKATSIHICILGYQLGVSSDGLVSKLCHPSTLEYPLIGGRIILYIGLRLGQGEGMVEYRVWLRVMVCTGMGG